MMGRPGTPATKIVEPITSPVPSSPYELSPEHTIRPPTTAHACSSPSETSVVLPPRNTGVARSVVSPVPSCPAPLAPQQYWSPVFVMAHVESPPAETFANVSVPVVIVLVTGAIDGATAPIWPWSLSPQQIG